MENKDMVSRQEFDNLREKVDKLENSVQLLIEIDKKVDGISIKLDNARAMEELKLNPLKIEIQELQKKVATLEENDRSQKSKLISTLSGFVVSIVLSIVGIVYSFKK